MEERMKFVLRLLEGEAMSTVCREFGISRKTGNKLFERYKDCGLEAFTDRSRRPFRYGNPLPVQVETAILQLKRESLIGEPENCESCSSGSSNRR